MQGTTGASGLANVLESHARCDSQNAAGWESSRGGSRTRCVRRSATHARRTRCSARALDAHALTLRGEDAKVRRRLRESGGPCTQNAKEEENFEERWQRTGRELMHAVRNGRMSARYSAAHSPLRLAFTLPLSS
mmetsp:Transcript_19326/g.37611  ORF Transcript_19326/g.37611 Transcript_19326/m.37611 type:complete len:134 (-) Transcript_19326:374-775(-)|eukprot:1547549-Pleurochrysis_carterae.AAC.1